MRPFVLLELGYARVVPGIKRTISAFVHESEGALEGGVTDNRAIGTHCLHPTVTLLEKLSAIQTSFANGAGPGTFIRHYEDATQIIRQQSALPELPYKDVRALLDFMLQEGDRIERPDATHAAYMPASTSQWKNLENAWGQISEMFWGARVRLDDACGEIRQWITNSTA